MARSARGLAPTDAAGAQAALADEVRQWQLVGCELRLEQVEDLRRSA